LPHAQFTVHVGDTLHDVRLLFSANPGVAPAPLQDCASGGELARLFLAIKLVLSDSPSMIVFDEIDSNVGGQTAALLGEKLRLLGQKRPVVCVTHFVQVAKCALDHFLVSKREKSGQSVTDIAKLGEKERLCEYNRMLGTVA
jgi:DNA repair protein RecN (Recombination protein N)